MDRHPRPPAHPAQHEVRDMHVEDAHGLRELCHRIADSDRIAFDTEYIWERSYTPHLGLLQVATDDVCAVVDPLAVKNLDPIVDLLLDAKRLKVLHAARGDLEVIYWLSGEVPHPIFDTQIAAAMVGYGDQQSLARLLERVLGVRLEKKETFTDWLRRPLTRGQIAYGLDDVRYLLPMHDHLVEELQATGRVEWVQEEFDWLSAPDRYKPGPAEEAFRRVRGRNVLDRRGMAILKELAGWREQEARDRDWHRGMIVRDEVLVEIARALPRSTEALRNTRGLHPREGARAAQALLACVERGLAIPDRDLPRMPESKRSDGRTPLIADLVMTYLKIRASDLKLAPSFLASRADIETLLEEGPASPQLDHPLLSGWRKTLVGEGLLALLDGRAFLGIDPETGKVRLYRIRKWRPPKRRG